MAVVKDILNAVSSAVMQACTAVCFVAATLYYFNIVKVLHMTDNMWIVSVHMH
jgi:hypothetical protein